MLKNVLIRGQYYYHLMKYRYNVLLQHECISDELRIKLKIKAIYHNSKVVELGSMM